MRRGHASSLPGIYRIDSTATGRFYIGSAIHLSNRRNDHYYALRENRHHNVRLQREWNKHGERSFVFSAVLYCAKSDLIFFEQRAIDLYLASKSLLNLSPTAGSTLGVKYSNESKARVSAASKGRSLGRKHTPEEIEKMRKASLGVNKGRKPSPETRQRMSTAGKGRKFTPEHRARISAALKGRKLPPEQIEHLRRINTGRKITEETRAKLCAASKGSKPGRKLSMATRLKMSAAHKGRPGRPFSDETRAKMSAAKKGKPMNAACVEGQKIANQKRWLRLRVMREGGLLIAHV